MDLKIHKLKEHTLSEYKIIFKHSLYTKNNRFKYFHKKINYRTSFSNVNSNYKLKCHSNICLVINSL